ncbi:hypothetical protein [Amycolatopsis taiwanensis]|uniref:Uncharacterized protein n=1 Tax=Amycolatopsis taiwanensis TaxID=342230 RepID=A0A9W6QZ31_9PSEU|nr:hypothetical protein [Amycolatopsis taiwanensis]GLY66348.1 hypothetical protein Atai01_29670 [Amycolatopsis taiwanensis]
MLRVSESDFVSRHLGDWDAEGNLKGWTRQLDALKEHAELVSA